MAFCGASGSGSLLSRQKADWPGGFNNRVIVLLLLDTQERISANKFCSHESRTAWNSKPPSSWPTSHGGTKKVRRPGGPGSRWPVEGTTSQKLARSPVSISEARHQTPPKDDEDAAEDVEETSGDSPGRRTAVDYMERLILKNSHIVWTSVIDLSGPFQVERAYVPRNVGTERQR